MGKLTPAITGKLVAFDSAPLIYYFEEHIEYLAAADELFNAISQGLTRGMTSILTLLEVLVKPLHSGRHDLAGDYRRIVCNTQEWHSIRLTKTSVNAQPNCELTISGYEPQMPYR